MKFDRDLKQVRMAMPPSHLGNARRVGAGQPELTRPVDLIESSWWTQTMKVKCGDCGFLTAQNHNNGSMQEVGADARKTGRVPQKSGNRGDIYQNMPPCFVDASDLFNEAGTEEAKSFAAVVNKERECDCFYPWRRGRRPRKHIEMQEQQKLREWQEARTKEDAKFRTEQRQADLDRADNLRREDLDRAERYRAEDRKQKRYDRIWAIVLLVADAILGAVLKR